MKKKLLLAFGLLFFITAYSFAQETSVLEYFPCKNGNIWTYAGRTGVKSDIYILRNSMPDPNNSGTSVYLVEEQMPGLGGSTATLYGIRNNRVVILTTRNIMGVYSEKKPPLFILALPGQEWSYNDRGDDLRYKTSAASCNVDNTAYNDCILVEERIVDGNTTLRTKKSYYARGVGLVLVTLQSRGEAEAVFMKLIDSSL